MIQKKSNGTYREYGSVLAALGLPGLSLLCVLRVLL